MKNLISFIFGLFFIVGNSQQYITVTSKTPDELVRDVFIGAQNANCIAVSNVTASSWQDYGNNPFTYAYFEKGTLPFDIEKGIILSTGIPQNAPGPNNKLLDDRDPNWLGDQDLANALGNPISQYLNATSLEFDFIANNTTGISFEYMFLSEEYRPDNCQYSDGFAFLIKKAGTTDAYTNIALVPGTLDPVTSLSINPSPSCQKNVNYFGGFNGTNSPTAFDGQTKVLTAKTDIVAGEKYHIKLVIADHLAGSDRTGRYDSAVFLKAGSFIGKKDLGPDLLISTNNSICEGATKVLNATTVGATSYQWFKEGIALSGETNALLSIPGLPTSNGNYEVEVSLGGCILKGTVRVEIQPTPIVNLGSVPFCDDKLAGSIPINFSSLGNTVINNYSPTYLPKYYLTKTDAQNNTGIPLPDGWPLTSDTNIYVRVESSLGCEPVIGEFKLVIGKKTPIKKSFALQTVCDSLRAGNVQIDLNNYRSAFTDDLTITPLFYASLADAKSNTNPISAEQTLIANSQTFGIRLQNSLDCANVGEITITKKIPNESTVLADQTICVNAKTTLDAGPGFTYYKWSNGEQGDSKSSISNVGIGEYWVELSSNGCVYRQLVTVTAAVLPQITNIEVSGNTATVFITGGTPPYTITNSWNSEVLTGTNIFTNIPRGLHKIYVKDANDCEIVIKELLILNLINVITPNADGINDVLDYSDLKIKKDVRIEIYDRYGIQVFISQNQSYVWDGKMNNRVLPSATYWYILSWIEPDTDLPVTHKGWVLLKNRN